MLKTLSVKNYALISTLQLDFSEGLTIVTGETGAGKSILLGALSLVLGQRADTSVLRNNEEKCVVEALFHVEKYDLKDFFHQHDIDYLPETLIRREIASGGKSRAFINDTPFPLQILKDLGDLLIDVHSQHQNLLLHNESFQLGLVDAFADGISPLLDTYRQDLQAYRKVQKTLQDLRLNYDKLMAEQAFIQFQFDELEKAKLVEGEKTELEERVKQLDHVEEIKVALTQAFFLLEQQEVSPVVASVKDIADQLKAIETYYPSVVESSERMASIYIDLKDISLELDRLQQDVDFDPEQAQSFRERLDLIYQLEKKHQVDAVEELIGLRDTFQHQLEVLSNKDFSVAELEHEQESLQAMLLEKTDKLTALREAATPLIVNKVLSVLHDLGMPHARVEVQIEQLEDFSTTGRNRITLLFSANRNERPSPISKVASGGEISRFMLAIKYLLSLKRNLPTIIFDEIDTGVSGEIADKMGNIFKSMSANMQVINITHLPQVAAKGDTHFMVYKNEQEELVQTCVANLGTEERIREIAKMLSGKEITPEALNNAKVLLAL